MGNEKRRSESAACHHIPKMEHSLAIIQSNPSQSETWWPNTRQHQLENQFAMAIYKRQGNVAEVRRTRKRVAHVARTGCTVQMSCGWGLRTFVAVSPQNFSPCNVHGISCKPLRVDPADRPTALTPRGASIVLIEMFATLTTSSSRTWDRGGSSCAAFVCKHTAHQSVTSIKSWHLSSIGTAPCSRNLLLLGGCPSRDPPEIHA